eukprot:scaffold4505_cov84-Skeletonema_dohrnii-CCMP3373.AAC.2
MDELLKHFKAEHYTVVKEAMTLLELALWKAKLDESQDQEEDSLKNQRQGEPPTKDGCGDGDGRME